MLQCNITIGYYVTLFPLIIDLIAYSLKVCTTLSCYVDMVQHIYCMIMLYNYSTVKPYDC